MAMARLIQWISRLGRRFLRSTLPLSRRLRLPPLSSLLLYIQALMMIIPLLRKPIWAFWYGTPLSGDRSLLGLYDDYIQTPGSVCSLWVKAAWDNNLSMKRYVVVCQFAFAFVFGILGLYFGSTSPENSIVEKQEDAAEAWKVFTIVFWFFLAGAIVNLSALRFEEWMAGAQEDEDEDRARPRRAMDRLDHLNSFENWEPEEDIQRIWERRGAISEQGGLGPRRFGQEVEPRERLAYVYPPV